MKRMLIKATHKKELVLTLSSANNLIVCLRSINSTIKKLDECSWNISG